MKQITKRLVLIGVIVAIAVVAVVALFITKTEDRFPKTVKTPAYRSYDIQGFVFYVIGNFRISILQ